VRAVSRGAGSVEPLLKAGGYGWAGEVYPQNGWCQVKLLLNAAPDGAFATVRFC